MVWFFALQLGWLPVQGYVSFGVDPAGAIRSLVMPSAALGLAYIALIARVTRAAMLEVLAQDYVRTARAKGVAEGRVVLWHALKNAAIPVITIVGIGFALLISGVVVTETVFNIAGVCRMIVDAVLARDYPVVQGTILFFSFTYIFINLLVDIAYVLLDPRIRY